MAMSSGTNGTRLPPAPLLLLAHWADRLSWAVLSSNNRFQPSSALTSVAVATEKLIIIITNRHHHLKNNKQIKP
jgi:hypothetical protein